MKTFATLLPHTIYIYILHLPTQEAVAVSPGGWCASALYGALVAVEGVRAEEQLPPAPRHQGGRHNSIGVLVH